MNIRIIFRLFIFATLFFCTQAKADPAIPQNPPEIPSAIEEQPLATPEEHMEPVSYQGAFVKMMLTLFGLIVLIIISVWMLRRLSQGRMKQMNSGRAIKILERRPLSAKSILYVIEIHGKKMLVSESQLEVRFISSVEESLND